MDHRYLYVNSFYDLEKCAMKKLASSVRKYKQLNWKLPRKVIKDKIDLSVPLIRIGEVPEIIYISSKEGKRRTYKHRTSSPMPVLYAHPQGKYFVLRGGNVKIKDWLYD